MGKGGDNFITKAQNFRQLEKQKKKQWFTVADAKLKSFMSALYLFEPKTI